MAFWVSPDEGAQIKTAVKLTGLTKQDYIFRRLLCRDVVVPGDSPESIRRCGTSWPLCWTNCTGLRPDRV